ncbi:MAG: hypothetical protein RBR53_09010 [Desulforegulaceae bacterium]|nr:hypothetical protein [Desulforegulaceae bacterium]
MTKKKLLKQIIDSHLDCFGEFDSKDSICRTKCALCIKCYLEKHETQSLLFSDEIFGTEDNSLIIQ